MASDTRGDDNQDGREREELIRLLCRALSRLAVAAHGVDRRLDQMLAELRQLLRRDIDDPDQLVELIDAIDKRIKLVDDERDARGDMVQQSLQQMTEQLLAMKPATGLATELKSLLKQLRNKSEDGAEVAVLARLPHLQGRVLQGGNAPRTGLLTRIFGGAAGAVESDTARPQSGRDEREQNDEEECRQDEAESDSIAASDSAEPTAVNDAWEVTASTHAASSPSAATQSAIEPQTASDTVAADDEVGTEPPFARISTAVCDVLNNLLQQIEPPPIAKENYQHACQQVSKGLNWYELVSTLEEVSLVVLAALERDQGDFQHFLLTLNNRLEQAHQALQASQQHQSERARDDDALNTSVRGEVAQIQDQVANATQLESLKAEVKQRLNNIVGAMDHHKVAEQQRQSELEAQLATLTERLSEMEGQSAAVEQRLLEQQRLALLDMLTQLPNRQAYEQRLEQEFERWQRYQSPLVLAVLDVDHFKSINDNYGHLAGDKVLRIIAKTLRARLRKTDFIARFGGEEFVVLMPETTLDAALQTLQAVCAAVAECPFHFRAQPISITLSGGIAEFVAGVEADAVFERADAALYRAKAAGRNRCIVATS